MLIVAFVHEGGGGGGGLTLRLSPVNDVCVCFISPPMPILGEEGLPLIALRFSSIIHTYMLIKSVKWIGNIIFYHVLT